MQRYESSIPFVGRLTGNSTRKAPRSDRSNAKTRGWGWETLGLSENPLPAIYATLRSFGRGVWEVLRWGGSGWHFSKIFSLLLLATTVTSLAWLHQTDNFFVYPEDVVFYNTTYVPTQELYARSQVEGWSTFWLDRDKVREALLTHDYIADAKVTVGLPARVSIHVTEEQPIALWVTDTGTHWLLEDGKALHARHEQTDQLLHILDGQAAARSVSHEAVINMDQNVLDNARKLASYFPELRTVTFNSGFGLNFAAPQTGIWVYWGDGRNFERKLKNLLTIQNELSQGRISGQLADLRVAEKPIVR